MVRFWYGKTIRTAQGSTIRVMLPVKFTNVVRNVRAMYRIYPYDYKPWQKVLLRKWIHTPSCMHNYCEGRLYRCCLTCLIDFDSGLRRNCIVVPEIKKVIDFEKCKMRSLQQHCIKQIIEKKIPISQLPPSIIKQIEKLKR